MGSRSWLVTVNEIVRALEETLRKAAGEKFNIKIQLDPEAGGAGTTPEALQRLLLELVCQAKKSIGEGGSLTIATKGVALSASRFRGWREMPGGRYVMLSTTACRARSNKTDTNAIAIQSASVQVLLPPPQPARAEPIRRRTEQRQETILLIGRDFEARSALCLFLLEHGYAVLETINEYHAGAFREMGAKIDLAITLRSRGEERIPDWLQSQANFPILTLQTGSGDDMGGGDEPEDVLRSIRLKLDSWRSRTSVLVVDDDDPVRQMIATLLEAAGYEVSEARNGGEALRLIAEKTPHIVLTELVMPEVDGLQLIQELRKSEPQIKIVGMSGSQRAGSYLPVVARALGAQSVLSKPLHAGQLLETLEQVLEDCPKS